MSNIPYQLNKTASIIGTRRKPRGAAFERDCVSCQRSVFITEDYPRDLPIVCDRCFSRIADKPEQLSVSPETYKLLKQWAAKEGITLIHWLKCHMKSIDPLTRRV